MQTFAPLKKERVIAFDVLRIIAIFAVIMIHASADLVIHFPIDSSEFIVGNIFDGISRLGVPLFLMISGALMLDENKPLPMKKMMKTVLQTAIITFIWLIIYALIYEVAYPLHEGKEFDADKFVKTLFFGRYHLWYMFAIIGLYLITPILRLFVKKQNAKYVLYFLLLALIFQFAIPIPNLLLNKTLDFENYIANFYGQFNMSFVLGYPAYYLLGWYVANIEIKKVWRIVIYVLGLLGMAVTVLGPQFLSTEKLKFYAPFYDILSLNVLLYSFAVFMLVFYLFKGKNGGKSAPVLTKISSLTFGVYLMHEAILFFLNYNSTVKNAYAHVSLTWLLTTAVSFSLALGISYIPFVKKIIKC